MSYFETVGYEIKNQVAIDFEKKIYWIILD